MLEFNHAIFMRELIITNTRPDTLSSFLQKKFPRGYVRKLFDKKGVRVNGERGKKETRVKNGDVLTFYVAFEPDKRVIPPAKQEPGGFQVLFENEDFMVVDKKAGVAVHEGKTVSHSQSLLGRIMAANKDKPGNFYLVHRLDKDTSGCLLLVKKEELLSTFEKMFESGQVDKEYVTLVKGVVEPTSGKISFPLPGRDGHLVSALTLYNVEKVFTGSNTSLVKVRIETGRMHQIRLHFAKLSHPVVMDDEHGDFAFNKAFRKAYGLKRQFLHAEKFSFTFQGKKYAFQAPLPPDLSKVLERFESLS